MIFLGIVSSKKNYLKIKKEIFKAKENPDKYDIIQITEDNVTNIKNITFNSIIIFDEIKWKANSKKDLEKVCDNSKYLIINSDIEMNLEGKNKKQIITFGMNQMATVTVSSITEDKILISLQRNIIDIEGNIKEVEEISVKNKKNFDIYILLIKYIIESIFF